MNRRTRGLGTRDPPGVSSIESGLSSDQNKPARKEPAMKQFDIGRHEHLRNNLRKSVARIAGIASFLGLIAGAILVYLAQGAIGA
jgi:hypothetical protein